MLSDDEGESFWPSFADLTSTIALILFVLVLLAYVRNLISGKDLAHTKAELQATLEQLRGAQRQVTAAERRLQLVSAEVDASRSELVLSETRIQQQEAAIAESERQIGELRGRLGSIAVLRVEVLKKVKDALEAQLGAAAAARGAGVSIADNGNVVIEESLLFETDSHAITAQGKRFVASLASAFAHVLEDPAVRESIDAVVVQGHTDERGSTGYNRELSARRANAVLDQLFTAQPVLEQQYGSWFAATAFSEFRPISPDRSAAGLQRNRRIELSVVLRDAAVTRILDEYMRGRD